VDRGGKQKERVPRRASAKCHKFLWRDQKKGEDRVI